MDWQGAGLSPGHLVRLTSRPLIFSLGGGYIKDAVYVPPLATTFPELAGRIRDAVATVTLDLSMCGPKLNINMIFALTLIEHL
jgi:hypothetical protein